MRINERILWHEQSFIVPISLSSPSLMKWGTPNTEPSLHKCGLLMVAWIPFVAATTHAYHYPITHPPPPMSHLTSHIEWMLYGSLHTPRNVKILPEVPDNKCSSGVHPQAQYVCQHTLFPVGQSSRDGGIINQEVCCVPSVNGSTHFWMLSLNNNNTRCS